MALKPPSGDHAQEHGHNHDHGHEHDHEHYDDMDVRVRALETVLVEKGYIDPAAIDALIETYENDITPRNGAKVVAKSWVDQDFRAWLLDDASAAVASLGFTGRQGEHIVAVENTDAVHNMVVCTLCSCYPVPLLGLPPKWYKAPAYRAQAVIDPRGVLAQFNLFLPDTVTIRVWDSTADTRYLVIPQRPVGTGHLSEDELARLVTRDAMIGTAVIPAGDHA
ncbi:nitrile hydratase [Devosia lucknowensis]|uniref:nitrile hydratase n=1 Tax=Devosia lucknowensis TaxID=1096929 RepID=A0A1Y6G7H7_9HYPH|nr:nitrile hydratase subunit alpha [Devosia lucknowensis]SMQ85704.1 nitrile hydratase [Devosia lucknowensis]